MNTAAELEPNSKYRYFAGTLKYTTGSLFMLFFWMLLGSFFFSLTERLIPVLMPLSLRAFDCSNQTIGLVVGSVPSVLNIIINPWISFRSDRTRSKWGRRIPYLAVATPFVTIFLVLAGWAPQMGVWLASVFSGVFTPATAGVMLLIGFSIFYQIFNLFVGSVFYYLFADVMPEQFMGRFVACFNLVGLGANFVFQSYLLGYAQDYMAWIYTVIAVLYGVFFMVMCVMVREGEYPPPEETDEKPNAIDNIKLYVRECFSIPFYLWFFIGTALNAASTVCRGLFGIFFAQENIGLDLADYGKISGYIALFMMVLIYPLGWLADRLHPLRVYMSAVVLVIITNIFSYFLTVDRTSFIVTATLMALVYGIQGASTLPMFALLLPKDRYGQFCSAQAVFQALLLVVANWGGGLFIDWTGDFRNLYVWDIIFTTLALIAMIQVYRGWIRHGGMKNYVAP